MLRMETSIGIHLPDLIEVEILTTPISLVLK